MTIKLKKVIRSYLHFYFLYLMLLQEQNALSIRERDAFLYDTFPEGFKWSVSTSAYQVKIICTHINEALSSFTYVFQFQFSMVWFAYFSLSYKIRLNHCEDFGHLFIFPPD